MLIFLFEGHLPNNRNVVTFRNLRHRVYPYRMEPRRTPGKGSEDGNLHTALDDTGGDGITREARSIVDVQLFHQMPAMLLNSLDADAEFRRGFLVSLSFRDQLKHLGLAAGEQGRFLMREVRTPLDWRMEPVETSGDRGTEIILPEVRYPDRLAHVVSGRLLEEKSNSSGCDRVLYVGIVVVS